MRIQPLQLPPPVRCRIRLLTTMPALPSLEGLTVRNLKLSMDPRQRYDGDANADEEIWRSGDERHGYI